MARGAGCVDGSTNHGSSYTTPSLSRSSYQFWCAGSVLSLSGAFFYSQVVMRSLGIFCNWICCGGILFFIEGGVDLWGEVAGRIPLLKIEYFFHRNRWLLITLQVIQVMIFYRKFFPHEFQYRCMQITFTTWSAIILRVKDSVSKYFTNNFRNASSYKLHFFHLHVTFSWLGNFEKFVKKMNLAKIPVPGS